MSFQIMDNTTVEDVVYTKQRRVSCNGGGGALGHPLVWYSLEDGKVECEYCGCRFIYDPAKADA